MKNFESYPAGNYTMMKLKQGWTVSDHGDKPEVYPLIKDESN